jgi:hypothetical protein
MNDATKPAVRAETAAESMPLFRKFPVLKAKLPHVSLGLASGIDYHRLPRDFHRYFEEAVQPLDEGGYDR